MFVLIILGWILSIMQPPVIIWVAYSLLAVAIVIDLFIKVVKLASGADA